MIDHMAGLGVPVYFRVGVRGAYVIDRERSVFVPSYLTPGEADPTGCGNSSTAAAMVGMVEHKSFEETGPPAFMDQERRREAEKLVKTILKNRI